MADKVPGDDTHYFFKIEKARIRELVSMYKKYSHKDCKLKEDFLREPYIKTMFRNFEEMLSRDGRYE